MGCQCVTIYIYVLSPARVLQRMGSSDSPERLRISALGVEARTTSEGRGGVTSRAKAVLVRTRRKAKPRYELDWYCAYHPRHDDTSARDGVRMSARAGSYPGTPGWQSEYGYGVLIRI